jgi:transcriptional regulator with XRE-family HTH domain
MKLNETYHILKNARKSKKMTQGELGKLLHLPQGYVSQVESGKHDIKMSTLEDWARVLGFELMLIPRSQAAEISYLLKAGPADAYKQIPPAYGALPDRISDE